MTTPREIDTEQTSDPSRLIFGVMDVLRPEHLWELPDGALESNETVPIITWLFDGSDGSVTWSYDFANFLGFGADEVGFEVIESDGPNLNLHSVSDTESGKSIERLVLGPVVDWIKEHGEIPGEDRRLTVLCPDGTHRSLLARAWPVESPIIKSTYGRSFSHLYTGAVLDITAQLEFELMLASLMERYRLLSDVSPDAVTVHQDGKLVYGNKAAQKLSGLKARAGYGRSILEFIHPDDVPDMLERIAALSEQGHYFAHGKARIVGVDGTITPVEVTSVLTTWAGRPAYQVIMRDLTKTLAAEAAAKAEHASLLAAEERYEAVVASLSEGVVLIDPAGIVSTTNAAAHEILGTRLLTGIGHQVFSGGRPAVCADGKELLPRNFPHVKTLQTGEDQDNIIIGVIDDDGNDQWLSLSTRLIGDGNSEIEHAVVCSFTDVTDRKTSEERLEWLAFHDTLTGLPNREMLSREIEREIANNRNRDSGTALFFVDLDRFKMVNDSFGHHIGDEVLREIAFRLTSNSRENDIVARLSGDEFIVLCRDIPSAEIASRIASGYLDIVGAPIPLSTGRTVTMTCSVGVSFTSGGEDAAENVLQRADEAMFQAKKSGRSHVEVYTGVLNEKSKARLQDYDELRDAIKNGELSVHYQPIAQVCDDKIVGFEALVRWEHPTRGMLSPLEFVPLAEETDLIFALGRWVMREACATMAKWQNTTPGAEGTCIAVNLSPHQLHDPDLLATVVSALADSGLPAESLTLEITETAMMSETDDAKQLLADISALGVKLAIDDFGIGHSSLAQLKRFPANRLKIDKAFIDDVATDPQDQAIVEAIVRISETFNLSIIAEGIETVEQLDTLKKLGCGYYQGYLLSRPVPPDSVVFTV